ncbi:MAG: indolepyruvate oxidoreductase subunit beta [Euryarchaeota archaeon]|nr:indolepyruvate oxidoreductase subunit beta [Euryarchaeota archaeon]
MLTNILIAGVGGQGIILLSDVLGNAAISSGLSVRGSETHGMAQRGGSVVAHVRIGEARSPLIPRGRADYLLALEPLEALRYLDYLKEGCLAAVSTSPIPPASVHAKVAGYPCVEEVLEELSEYAEVFRVNALKLAKRAGAVLTANVVMLGALSALPGFPLDAQTLRESVASRVPPKTVEMNLKAFNLGREAVKG